MWAILPYLGVSLLLGSCGKKINYHAPGEAELEDIDSADIEAKVEPVAEKTIVERIVEVQPQEPAEVPSVEPRSYVISGTLFLNGPALALKDPPMVADNAEVYIESHPELKTTTNQEGLFSLDISSLFNTLALQKGALARITLLGRKVIDEKVYMIREPDIQLIDRGVALGSMDLRETGGLAGNVSLGDKSRGFEDIKIYIPNSPYQTLTTPNGDFALEPLPEGKFEIVAEKQGYDLRSLGTFEVASARLKNIGKFILDEQDRFAPQTTFLTKPSEYVAADNVTFSFSASEQDVIFYCRIDNEADQICLSPWKVEGLEDGPHTVTVYAADNAGNAEVDGATYGFTVDTVVPEAGTITLTGTDKDGASTTLTRLMEVAVDLSGFVDQTSSLKDMRMGLKADLSQVAWQNYQSNVTFLLSATDGPKQVYLQVRDQALNESSTVSANIVLDQTAPQTPSLFLDDGKAFATSGNVMAALGAQDAVEMKVSLDGNFSNMPWEAFSPTKTLDLGNMDGRKVVYALYRDEAGNETDVVIDDITIDSQLPVNIAISINGGDAFTKTANVVLQLSAQDADQMQISGDGTFDTEPWISYSNSETFVLLGADCAMTDCKTVSARFRDAAGNMTAIVSDSITLDRSAPTVPQFVTAEQIVNADSITLKIAAPVNETFFRAYQVAGGPNSYPQFVDFSTNQSQTSFTVNLDQDATNFIRLRAVDQAGNLSGEAALTIVEDSTPPERPQNVKFFAGNGKLKITWDSSPSPDVSGYIIKYGAAGNSVFVPITDGAFANEGDSPIRVGDINSFTLTGLPNDNYAYVLLQAVDKSGQTSALPTEAGTQGSAKARPNPVSPELLASYSPTVRGVPTSTDVRGDILVLAERCTYDKSVFAATGNPTPDQTCDQDDGGFRVLSLADPAAPLEIARCSSMPGESCGLGTPLNDVTDVLIDGNLLYLAAGNRGVMLFDLTNPAEPQLISECGHDGTCLPADGFARAIALQAGKVFVADGPGGLRTLENSQRGPFYHDQVMRCSGQVSSSCALKSLGDDSEYDADGLLANHAVDAVNYDLTKSNKRCQAMDVAINGQLLYLLMGSGVTSWCSGKSKVHILRLLDEAGDGLVNDAGPPTAFFPTAVEEVAVFNQIRASQVYVSGDVLYVADTNLFGYHIPSILSGDSQNEAKILQIDISVDRLEVLGPILMTAGHEDNVANALQFFDLANLATIISDHAGSLTNEDTLTLVGNWGNANAIEMNPRDLTVSGSLIFMAQGRSTDAKSSLEILDLQTPFIPSKLTLNKDIEFIKQHYHNQVLAHDRFLVISDYQTRLFDISDIKNPNMVSVITDDTTSGHSIALDWPFVFVGRCNASFNGVSIYDLSSPQSPSFLADAAVPNVGGCNGNQRVSSVALHGNLLYIGNGIDGVYVYDVTLPKTPIIINADAGNNPIPVAPSLDGFVLDMDLDFGSLYLTLAGCSGDCSQTGFSAVKIPSLLTSTADHTAMFTTRSHYEISGVVPTSLNGARSAYLWGGKLFGKIGDGQDIILGAGSLTSVAQQAAPIDLTQTVGLLTDLTGGWGFGGSGRFLYHTGLNDSIVIDITKPLDQVDSLTIPGVISVPQDLGDSIAVGGYGIFFATDGKLIIYDFMF